VSEQPTLKVVRGDATAEEIAVLIAIVTAVGSGDEQPPARPVTGRWSDPAHAMRKPWTAGPGGWRAAR
jgi:hypothetical protein